MYKRVLVPVDDTEQSYCAVDVAGWLASASGGSVTLFHVRKPTEEVVTDIVTKDPLMQQGELRKQKQIFRRCDKILSAYGVKANAIAKVDANIAGSITSECETGKYDAIVMGHRGRSQLKQLMLGSVANGVLVEAKCPTIMVHVPRGGAG
ncbi:MAG: Universal stress protein [Methanocella sp. PtaU1.Bin125]|nr:MAG: Universal stress protein [Methanocella sp. PtaU1.Bin125]